MKKILSILALTGMLMANMPADAKDNFYWITGAPYVAPDLSSKTVGGISALLAIISASAAFTAGPYDVEEDEKLSKIQSLGLLLASTAGSLSMIHLGYIHGQDAEACMVVPWMSAIAAGFAGMSLSEFLDKKGDFLRKPLRATGKSLMKILGIKNEIAEPNSYNEQDTEEQTKIESTTNVQPITTQ